MRLKSHRLLDERARRSTFRVRLLAKAVFSDTLVRSATPLSIKRRQTGRRSVKLPGLVVDQSSRCAKHIA